MKIQMKPKYIIAVICIAILVTVCSLLPSESGRRSAANSDAEPGTELAYVAIGSHLTVQNTDPRLTLLSNLDTLSADGLYYVSWVSGDSEPYENIDGDTVYLYDAQLHLLLGEFKTSDAAQQNMDTWYAIGTPNYDISDEKTVTCNEQSYTMITYTFVNKEDPFARGVSVFGVYKNIAVCVELTCRENYQEDLEEMLTKFLNSCTYD